MKKVTRHELQANEQRVRDTYAEVHELREVITIIRAELVRQDRRMDQLEKAVGIRNSKASNTAATRIKLIGERSVQS